MGARGPVSPPARLKIVKSPEAEAAPETLADQIVPGAPEKPQGMPPAANDLWDVLVPQLDELGLICTVDGLTVDLALRHYLAALQASDELSEADSVSLFDEKNGRQQKHPADAVFRLHSHMFLQYADKLGMTFVSRARLAARGGAGDSEENPFLSGSGGS